MYTRVGEWVGWVGWVVRITYDCRGVYGGVYKGGTSLYSRIATHAYTHTHAYKPSYRVGKTLSPKKMLLTWVLLPPALSNMAPCRVAPMILPYDVTPDCPPSKYTPHTRPRHLLQKRGKQHMCQC